MHHKHKRLYSVTFKVLSSSNTKAIHHYGNPFEITFSRNVTILERRLRKAAARIESIMKRHEYKHGVSSKDIVLVSYREVHCLKKIKASLARYIETAY